MKVLRGYKELVSLAGIKDNENISFEDFTKKAIDAIHKAEKMYYNPVMNDKDDPCFDEKCKENIKEAIKILELAQEFRARFGF